MCVLGRYVASTVLLSTQTFGREGADRVGGQLRGNKEWRKQFWQSLEEGAGKRCGSVPPDLSLLCGRTGWDGARLVIGPPPTHPPTRHAPSPPAPPSLHALGESSTPSCKPCRVVVVVTHS